ncbi:OmpA family protein [Flavobacterium sp. ASW18X]|uniref:OmpA family protein n=1 Tax=Flavobacterium sp. ASW18X TaxID=2572595 RepID=UPI001F0DB41C|nr:OmpA family protein [Flavobacterium sp. ASW18X]
MENKHMLSRSIVLILMLVLATVHGQQRVSKGDGHFFAYAYDEAIVAYEKDIKKGLVLSSEQKLNLADCYFMTGGYKNANELYLQLFDYDVDLGSKRINRLFRSLEETGDVAKVRDLIYNDSLKLSNQLIENMDFNNRLLAKNVLQSNLDFNVFLAEISSNENEFSPSFYIEELLYTTSKSIGNSVKNKEGYLNIYSSSIVDDGNARSPKLFSKIQNTDFHEATPFYSEKLNSIFYVLSNTFEGELEFNEQGKNALAIGMQRIDGEFRYLWRDLSTSFYYPFYDERNGRLYFAADFGDGYGGTDLYYVTTNNGQVMSAPVNLGPRINTLGNEVAPYIFEGTLYFSSDIFYGLGGMDVYKSELREEDQFSIPVNLGTAINSEKDDFGFIIRNHGDGLLGYFSSNREGGRGGDDIYGFMVDEKPGLKTLVLSGTVQKDHRGNGVSAASVAVLDGKGEVLKATTTDQDGNYHIEIPWQEEVVVEVFKKRYSTFYKKYDASALEALQKTPFNPIIAEYDEWVEETEGQKVLKLRKFYFQKGSSTITPAIAKELDKVVEAVGYFPQMQLRIETHTDSRGGSATNFRITQARSNALKKYLIQQGVPASNILYAVGYGEQKILNDCTNGKFCLEMLHQQNQRSLFVVLNDNILFD